MQKNVSKKRNTTRLITTPLPYAVTFLLIAISFVPLIHACMPEPGIHLEKTGPLYAYAGDAITFTYQVSNTENQPLSDVTVIDDSCGPVCYVAGDNNHNEKLDHNEVWTYSCTTTPDFSFPDPLTNTATASGTWQCQTAEDTAQYTLYPFILRKAVLLYWEGESVDYTDPDTLFTIQMTKGEQTLDCFPISETAPQYLWLSQGTYTFTELNIPDGYLPAYDNITVTTGETYPDFSALNIITFDLSVEKTGPATCYPDDQITYNYTVHNTGPASVTPLLEDDHCGTPVYMNGDSNQNSLIDPCETWTYEASYTVNAEPGCVITNIVNVTDAEGATLNSELWWLGGDTNSSNNAANWSVTVVSQPEEPENPDEPENPEEPQEPEQPEEPHQPTITAAHGPGNHYGDLAPIADANGPYSAFSSDELSFNGSSSYDPDGFIIAYHWTFGDGDTGTGATATHTYIHGGVYPVTLTVIDNFGVSNTNTTSANIIVPNRPPAAPLISGPANGTATTDYTYLIGSTDEDHDDLSYLIDWGDGTTTVTGSYPSGVYDFHAHLWSTPGEYTITVTVSDGQTTTTAHKHVTIQETSVSSNIALLILTLLALLAVIIMALASRKKKSKNNP
jgi:chitodextrinase